jgi:hypothetical protein
LLCDACYREDGNPLSTMHALLSGPQGAPIRDLHDARQYSMVGQPDAEELGSAVRFLYAKANLAVAEAVRNDLADVEF